MHRGLHHKRIANAVTDVCAQIAVISRVSGLLDQQGVELSGQERFIADVFCARAALRVEQNLHHIEHNDDDGVTAISRLATRRGAYGLTWPPTAPVARPAVRDASHTPGARHRPNPGIP